MAVLKGNFHFTVLCKFNRPSSRVWAFYIFHMFWKGNKAGAAQTTLRRWYQWRSRPLYDFTKNCFPECCIFFSFWKLIKAKPKEASWEYFASWTPWKCSFNLFLHNVRPSREFKQTEQLPCVSRIKRPMLVSRESFFFLSFFLSPFSVCGLQMWHRR